MLDLTLRYVVLGVLVISTVTFIALFGRVPALRNTSIGYIYRLLWIKLPCSLRVFDQRVSGGRLTFWTARGSHYLTEEKHPIVLLLFIALLSFSEAAFIPSAYPHLGIFQLVVLPPLILLPYIFIYLAWSSTSHLITPSNHQSQMRHYPYDHILFHPGPICRTCKHLKPARSKHCSICKTCISKHDHHCIWLNNCLGRGNYHYFILMLFFTGVLLSYGAYLAYIILSSLLQRTIPSTAPGQHWSIGKSWNAYFQFWAWAIVYYVRIGFVGLLALMCSPLAWGLLGYHLYLIWAGMTTNESVKWSDLREDIDDGLVLIRRKMGNSSAVPADHIITSTTTRPEYYPREWEDEDEEQDCLPDEDIEPKVAWPVSTSQVVVRTYNGGSPPPLSRLQREQGWRRVNGLQEIENIYDLGFWDNFLGIFEGG